MRSKTLILIMALAFVAGMAAVAGAIPITSTNHDMITHEGYTPAQSLQGVCSFCHVPHGAAGAKLFAPGAIVAPGGGWADDEYAAVCFGCHGGGGTYNNGAATRNLNPFDIASHANEVDQLVTWTDITAVGDLANFPGYYTSGGSSYIGCISCHNVHDNAIRPFLRNNDALDNATSGDNLAFGDFQTLCDDCHVTRELNAGVNDRINHPTNIALAGTIAGDASLYSYSGGNFVSTTQDLFYSTWPTNNGAVVSPDGDHWNLGGKFNSTTTDLFNCGTCHMTHQNEVARATYAVGDGLADNTEVAVTAVDWTYLYMAVNDTEPVVAGGAEICTACHNLITPDVGPGAGGFSHPWEVQFGTSITITNPRPGVAKFGGTLGAADGTLVCQSCHDMHFAPLGDTVSVVNEQVMLHGYCDACHSGASASFKGDHHPSGITITYGTNIRDDGGVVTISTGVNWDAVTPTIIDNNTVDATTRDLAGSPGDYVMTGGVMDCGTCHGGFGAKAHNNASGFPAFSGAIDEDQMCVDCHGFNPSEFTEHATAANGSHYLGSIINSGYQWGYGVSGAVNSVATAASATFIVPYADDTAVNGDLMCTSCHTLKTDTLTVQWSDNGDSGDAPGSNYELGANPSGVRNNDNLDNEDSTLDGVGLLLSPAGNDGADVLADQTDYLCTACHGESPGGGSTHPVLPAYTTASSATTVLPNMDLPNNYVTARNTDDTINCESCHRPHDADTEGSTYILEAAGGTLGTYIDMAVLCSSCHVQ